MQTLTSTASDVIAPYLPDQLPAGAKAGPWTVVKEIGRGGMGAVYAVVHEGIGKRAALKLIHRRLLHPQHIARMLVEARVVNRVAHPNIVDIFETGSLPDGRAYIVMERLDGKTLAARVAEGRLPPVEVIEILLQVCDALIAAHAHGVIHRDLKTDNVFLCDGDTPPRVKLLDWGIAKELETGSARQTSEGHVVGTPQYLAPEQARAGEVCDRTDVYSLGVMAYELLLEQLPFEAETSLEVMTMHLRSAPPPPHRLWPDIPPALDALLLAMLAKEPHARPSAREVATRFAAVRDELQARRGLPVLRARASTRSLRAVAPIELAPTRDAVDDDVWPPPPPSRRWQYALGVAALAFQRRAVLHHARERQRRRRREPGTGRAQGERDRAAAVAEAGAGRGTAGRPCPGGRDTAGGESDRESTAARACRDAAGARPSRRRAAAPSAGRATPAARPPPRSQRNAGLLLMRASSPCAVLVLAASAPAIANAPVKLNVPAKARALAERGRARHDAGDYAAAIAAFTEAYALAPSSALLFNLAQSYRLAGDCDDASTMYRRFLATEPPPEARALARTSLIAMDRCAAAPGPIAAQPVAATIQARATTDAADHAVIERDTGMGLCIGGGIAFIGSLAFELRARDGSGNQMSEHGDAALSDAFGIVGVTAVGAGIAMSWLGLHEAAAHHVAIAPTQRGAEVHASWRF